MIMSVGVVIEALFHNMKLFIGKNNIMPKLNPWYSHYSGAEQRCNNPHNASYKRYGKRGIKMLMTSKSFKFLWFRDKAYLLKQASIDRKNTNGHYILENCRFIEQIENTRRNYV